MAKAPTRPPTPRRRLGDVDATLIQRLLVPFKIIRAYCRVTVEGLENVPSGPLVFCANHTGWLGLDYANLALAIHDATGRIVRGIVHPLWYRSPAVADYARRLGLVPATRTNLTRLLRQGKAVIVFPEGEQGAFKAESPDGPYRLRPFRSGFVRAAFEANAPIVPVAILGGEEANPVLTTLSWTDRFLGLPLPVPRNILPRPVKWRISFLSPVRPPTTKKRRVADAKFSEGVARALRDRIERELRIQMERRGNPYL